MKLSRRERWAIIQVFEALELVDIEVESAEEAEQTLDLAARLLSYATQREWTVEELKEKMEFMMRERMH